MNKFNTDPLIDQSEAVFDRIEQCLLQDRPALRSLWKKHQVLAKEQALETPSSGQKDFFTKLQGSIDVAEGRASLFQKIDYPQDLPVVQSRLSILKAIEQHQVVVVAGETGSGKTTQIPKLCAELGRGIVGRIGHTQPRRLAARTVAARIADELGVQLGTAVGYQFRFKDQFNSATRIKIMTDGILLAAINRDRLLLEYDTLIIDEAHERSLNIDFLLGYLKILLPKRPDLKLIITSATIDVERFSRHFDCAPVIEVTGRSYPVDIQYLNSEVSHASDQRKHSNTDNDSADFDGDLNQQIKDCLALIEQQCQGASLGGPRDVLVFLPGEREIRDLSQFLKSEQANIKLLPLYSRLSQKEQQRIFSVAKPSKKRRVILATNVAETSVTVPGIGFVIDPGMARISRYSARSKLQRLPIEAISQASANQRAGRCGRIAAGTCYRLYSEADFNQRPEFTEPELLRTNLAAVVLQMKALKLGEIQRFPFLEQPDSRQVRSGIKTLEELGALNHKGQLSQVGQSLACLPIDPRLGRMLLAAFSQKCLPDLLVIVSALAVQDPREYPSDKRQAADMKHRRFWHSKSDFLSWINLWHYYDAKLAESKQNQLRKLCKRDFLSYPKMREWRDMHRQLLLAIKPLVAKQSSANVALHADRAWLVNAIDNDAHQLNFDQRELETIHTALLTGLATNIGGREKKGEYRGVRNLRFFLFPASSQFKPAPRWVMSAEIVETRKVYARTLAAIDPLWVLKAVPQLINYEYNEPYWDVERGQVMAYRSSSLLGLKILSRQLVVFESIDAELSRQIFVQQALAECQLKPNVKLLALADFWRHNQLLIDQVKCLEEKTRRRDLLVDDLALADFYQRNLPEKINSRRALQMWLSKYPKQQQSLFLQRSEVLLRSEFDTAISQFPDSLRVADLSVPLQYHFGPGDEKDGLTAIIPLAALAYLPIYPFDWLVPGMLRDKCIDLVKALPKVQRKRLVPVPSVVDNLLDKIDCEEKRKNNVSLTEALAEQINIYYSLSIDPMQWRITAGKSLDRFCLMRFEIHDKQGLCIKEGRDLAILIEQCRDQLDESVDRYASHGFRQKGLSRWDFGALSTSHEYQQDGMKLRGFPALIDDKESVSLDLLASPAEALTASREGVARLLMLGMADKIRYLKKQLIKDSRIILPYYRCGNQEELIDDIIKAAVVDACLDDFERSLPRNQSQFDNCIESGKGRLVSIAVATEALLLETLSHYQKIHLELGRLRKTFPLQCEDIDRQLRGLIYPGFLYATGVLRLQHLPRYMKGILIRLDKLGGSAKKDLELCENLSSLEQPLKNLLYKYPESIFSDVAVDNFRWLLEELRVSLFAQQLKTVQPVSLQRALKEWKKINHNKYPMTS
ncbi:MAG: ATP-dependent RNA helicase HrpA [Pseudomonadales bacterium]|nr:ATP-dependent RNA helicase HrpA [Pseudomonadales bacterium]